MPFVLRFDAGGEQEQVVQLVALTSADAVIKSLKVRRPGGKWLTPHRSSNVYKYICKGERSECYELRGSNVWYVLATFDNSCPGFLYHVFAYSKFCPASLAIQDHVEEKDPPLRVSGLSSALDGIYLAIDETWEDHRVYEKDDADLLLCWEKESKKWWLQKASAKGSTKGFLCSVGAESTPELSGPWCNPKKDWKEDDLVTVTACTVVAQAPDSTQSSLEPSKSEDETLLLAMAQTSMRSHDDPQMQADLSREPNFLAGPTRQKTSAALNEKVTVPKAYLHRIHAEVMRLRSMQAAGAVHD